jgi:hypothetical protein
MIRKLRITVNNFIRNELPSHLRGYADMLTFFRGLMAPLKAIADEWVIFRDASITRARVTGETASLTWYLNELFDNVTRGIYIDTAGLSGVAAGDEVIEPTVYVVAGDELTEPTVYAVAGIDGEGTDFQGRSFCVFVPTAVAASDNDISAIVRQYKLAGKTFIIKRI